MTHGFGMPSYLQTYLERDVRDLAQIGSLRDFDRMMRLLAARSGTLLNYAGLSRDLGVSANTVKAWVSILEASGIVLVCAAYYQSLGKRVIKSPKVYLMETGLLAHLTHLESADALFRGPLAGPVFGDPDRASCSGSRPTPAARRSCTTTARSVSKRSTSSSSTTVGSTPSNASSPRP
ncbi:MAG: DUF4143 domain-containing protein [Proteobacteria bacterium]|nr:DUF4143 domain-containing protein [Pseudomonadota bacterium]